MIVIFDITLILFITENPGGNGLACSQRIIELQRKLSTHASS